MASQNGRKEVAQLLLHSGAQPNIPDKVSITNLILLSSLLYSDTNNTSSYIDIDRRVQCMLIVMC